MRLPRFGRDRFGTAEGTADRQKGAVESCLARFGGLRREGKRSVGRGGWEDCPRHNDIDFKLGLNNRGL